MGLTVNPRPNPDPIELQVNRTGLWHGKPAKVVYIIGRRSQGWNSTSLLGDVADYLDTSQNNINPVSTGTTYYLRSSSVNDTATGPGTGAQAVRIVYLDAAGVQQVTTVNLDGTTGVSLGTGFSAFQWTEVSAVGSGEVSAGNITISSVSGAPSVAQIVGWITAGGNRSLSCRYTVPAGQTAYLIEWDANAISANMDCRIRAFVFADDRALSTAIHFQDEMYLASNVRGLNPLNYLKCPAGCLIKCSAIPANAQAGNRADCSFKMIVVDN